MSCLVITIIDFATYSRHSLIVIRILRCDFGTAVSVSTAHTLAACSDVDVLYAFYDSFKIDPLDRLHHGTPGIAS